MPQPNPKYTADPNEVPLQLTTPPVRDVVTALRASWPGLGEQGGRTMTAQFVLETGWGKHCFNWNIGNMKPKTAQQTYAFRPSVWECYGPSDASSYVANGHGLVHLATADEIKQHEACTAPKVMVIFLAPHDQCRFLAFASLLGGAQALVERHKKVISFDPNYLSELNAADIPNVVSALNKSGYFTSNVGQYTASMISVKARIDKQLGPPKP